MAVPALAFGVLFGPVAIALGWWRMALGIAALTFALLACGVAPAACGTPAGL